MPLMNMLVHMNSAVVDVGMASEETLQSQGEPKPPGTDISQYNYTWRPWRMNISDFAVIANTAYSGAGTVTDPYIVTWLDHDAENPKDYTTTYKWFLTFLVAVSTLCVALASSAFSGATEPMLRTFGCSEEIIILALSIMVVGYAIGPLVWAPISEAIGRREIFIITMFIYTIWISCTAAVNTVRSMIVLRFFAGVFGSSALVIPGGIIADIFTSEMRGYGIGVFCAAPLLGPSLGPLIGGFISDASGFRWVMGFLGLFAGLLTFLIWLLLPETYPPVLLRRRAKMLSQITGKTYLTAADFKKPLVAKEIIEEALLRPWVMLFREPIVLIFTLYMACVYGTLYLLFAAFPIVFQVDRGWNAGVGGLAFMGVAVGMILGAAYVTFDNRRYIRHSRANKGVVPPEVRLPPAIFGGASIIIGLAWFAATNSPKIHWAVSISAGLPFAFGFVLVFVSLGNYLVDTYVIYAASVLAANSVVRSLFGAVFPLFATYMFKNLGIHWASAVPGFIALACFPFPILFYIYGARIRLKCKYAAQAAAALAEMRTVKDEED
ncbi:MFS transporter [Halenospora varia]|nr:MFS transporter [Halenospora varia]